MSAPQEPPELSPLDYALRIMRDDTQPAAEPDDTPDEAPRLSDLELARRIAFILATAQA